MTLSRAVAHFVTHHRRGISVAVALLVLLSGAVLALKARFASDVLDLLPQHFDSVRVFKLFDREFSQARELMFAVVDDSGEVDLDAFIEHFGAELREEPWVQRVMDHTPMESPDGLQDIPILAVPLLLNLPPAELEQTLSALDPPVLRARLHRLRTALESGSPKAEFDLGFDPLGIVGPALKPLAGSFSVEETRPLASPDGTLRVVLVLTTQDDLGARASQAMMRQVHEFRSRTLASWEGAKPQLLVTGRMAYVGELSLKMRNDVIWTLVSSALVVALVFWVGFRRLRPLLALVHTLLLCCVVAIAAGAFVFNELNMITIGLCAILVGLGVDFGMMLFGIYQSELDEGHDHETAVTAALKHHGGAIIFGAVTTAAAFLCLLRSETRGFVQLGVLIAFGILCAGGLMMTVFFVFLGKKHQRQPHDGLKMLTLRYLAAVYRHPRRITLISCAVLFALTAFAAAPIRRVQFEANPKSLEPRHSDAGDALRAIQARLPSAGEPILALVQAESAQDFHDRWSKLQQRWSTLVEAGQLRSVNVPTAFAISPARVEANAALLAQWNFAATREAFAEALQQEGLSTTSFAGAFRLLDTLEAAGAGDRAALDWRRALPAESPWWFVLNRFFGEAPFLGAGYITPAEPVRSFEQKEELQRALTVPGIEVHFSGWSFTLADLVPWARGKLAELSAAMIVLNVLILLFLFRRLSSLAMLMITLGLAVGALVASLKLFGVALNLFNVLAFPLVLGVGVDYGIYVITAMRAPDPRRELSAILKPVLLSGLTTAAGFSSLMTAENPALRSLGAVCGLGVAWCLVATFGLILPLCVWRERR